jgi:hypothetical protein
MTTITAIEVAIQIRRLATMPWSETPSKGSRPVVDGALPGRFSDPALTTDLRRLRVNGVALRHQDRAGAIGRSKIAAIIIGRDSVESS